MSHIIVYLSFKDNCAEAMSFYHQCIGGELILNKVEGSPMEAECPAAMKNHILHGKLTHGDLIIMASDWLSKEEFIMGTNASLGIMCTSEEEINTLFTKLSAGGTIRHPLKQQFWGAIFGMFTDRFGVRWLLNFENAPA